MSAGGSGSRALISLGSNIDPRLNLPRAVELLAGRLDVRAISSLWESPAKGAPGTPRFLNAAVIVETALAPEALKFDVLRPLEELMGRRRGSDPNEPRVIDLDLTLYDDLVVELPRPGAAAGLVLPDPELLASAHVILPAAEIAGGWRHPLDGRTLEELATPFREDPAIRTVGSLTG
jgi:2-amino-4-hydroxy-6-hydroxymethyldihydropteridine diphosphokinase